MAVYDVLALQTRRVPSVQAILDQDTGGALCSGVTKLAQRWILEFMTEHGSMPYLPTRGCPFMAAVRSGKLQTELDVFQAFAISQPVLEENLMNEEGDADADGERYAGCRLLRVGIAPGRIELQVRINSRSGTGASFSLPIKVSL